MAFLMSLSPPSFYTPNLPECECWLVRKYSKRNFFSSRFGERVGWHQLAFTDINQSAKLLFMRFANGPTSILVWQKQSKEPVWSCTLD